MKIYVYYILFKPVSTDLKVDNYNIQMKFLENFKKLLPNIARSVIMNKVDINKHGICVAVIFDKNYINTYKATFCYTNQFGPGKNIYITNSKNMSSKEKYSMKILIKKLETTVNEYIKKYTRWISLSIKSTLNNETSNIHKIIPVSFSPSYITYHQVKIIKSFATYLKIPLTDLLQTIYPFYKSLKTSILNNIKNKNTMNKHRNLIDSYTVSNELYRNINRYRNVPRNIDLCRNIDRYRNFLNIDLYRNIGRYRNVPNIDLYGNISRYRNVLNIVSNK